MSRPISSKRPTSSSHHRPTTTSRPTSAQPSNVEQFDFLESRPLHGQTQKYHTKLEASEAEEQENTAREFVVSLVRDQANVLAAPTNSGNNSNHVSHTSLSSRGHHDAASRPRSSLGDFQAYQTTLSSTARAYIDSALHQREVKRPASGGFGVGEKLVIRTLSATSEAERARRRANSSTAREQSPEHIYKAFTKPTLSSSSSAALSSRTSSKKKLSRPTSSTTSVGGEDYFRAGEPSIRSSSPQRGMSPQRFDQLAQPKHKPKTIISHQLSTVIATQSAQGRPTTAAPTTSNGTTSSKPSSSSQSKVNLRPSSSPGGHSLHSVASQEKLYAGTIASKYPSLASSSTPSSTSTLPSFQFESSLPLSLTSEFARSQTLVPLKPVHSMTREEKEAHTKLLTAEYERIMGEMVQEEINAAKEAKMAQDQNQDEHPRHSDKIAPSVDPMDEVESEADDWRNVAKYNFFDEPLQPPNSQISEEEQLDAILQHLKASSIPIIPPPIPLPNSNNSQQLAQQQHDTSSTSNNVATAPLGRSNSGYFVACKLPSTLQLIRWMSSFGQWKMSDSANLSNIVPPFIDQLPTSDSLSLMATIKSIFSPLSIWRTLFSSQEQHIELVKELWNMIGRNDRLYVPTSSEQSPSTSLDDLLNPLPNLHPLDSPSSSYLRAIFFAAWNRLPLSLLEFYEVKPSEGMSIPPFVLRSQRRPTHDPRLYRYRVLLPQLVSGPMAQFLRSHSFFQSKTTCQSFIEFMCAPNKAGLEELNHVMSEARTAGEKRNIFSHLSAIQAASLASGFRLSKQAASPALMDFDLFHAFILTLILISVGVNEHEDYELNGNTVPNEVVGAAKAPNSSRENSHSAPAKPFQPSATILSDLDSELPMVPEDSASSRGGDSSTNASTRRSSMRMSIDLNRSIAVSPTSSNKMMITTIPTAISSITQTQHKALSFSLQKVVLMFQTLMHDFVPFINNWIQTEAHRGSAPVEEEKTIDEPSFKMLTPFNPQPTTFVGALTRHSTPISRKGYTHAHAQLVRALSPTSSKQNLHAHKDHVASHHHLPTSSIPGAHTRDAMFEETDRDNYTFDLGDVEGELKRLTAAKQDSRLVIHEPSATTSSPSPQKQHQLSTQMPLPPRALMSPDLDGYYRDGEELDTTVSGPKTRLIICTAEPGAKMKASPARSSSPIRQNIRISAGQSMHSSNTGFLHPNLPLRPNQPPNKHHTAANPYANIIEAAARKQKSASKGEKAVRPISAMVPQTTQANGSHKQLKAASSHSSSACSLRSTPITSLTSVTTKPNFPVGTFPNNTVLLAANQSSTPATSKRSATKQRIAPQGRWTDFYVPGSSSQLQQSEEKRRDELKAVKAVDSGLYRGFDQEFLQRSTTLSNARAAERHELQAAIVQANQTKYLETMKKRKEQEAILNSMTPDERFRATILRKNIRDPVQRQVPPAALSPNHSRMDVDGQPSSLRHSSSHHQVSIEINEMPQPWSGPTSPLNAFLEGGSENPNTYADESDRSWSTHSSMRSDQPSSYGSRPPTNPSSRRLPTDHQFSNRTDGSPQRSSRHGSPTMTPFHSLRALTEGGMTPLSPLSTTGTKFHPRQHGGHDGGSFSKGSHRQSSSHRHQLDEFGSEDEEWQGRVLTSESEGSSSSGATDTEDDADWPSEVESEVDSQPNESPRPEVVAPDAANVGVEGSTLAVPSTADKTTIAQDSSHRSKVSTSSRDVSQRSPHKHAAESSRTKDSSHRSPHANSSASPQRSPALTGTTDTDSQPSTSHHHRHHKKHKKDKREKRHHEKQLDPSSPSLGPSSPVLTASNERAQSLTHPPHSSMRHQSSDESQSPLLRPASTPMVPPQSKRPSRVVVEKEQSWNDVYAKFNIKENTRASVSGGQPASPMKHKKHKKHKKQKKVQKDQGNESNETDSDASPSPLRRSAASSLQSSPSASPMLSAMKSPVVDGATATDSGTSANDLLGSFGFGSGGGSSNPASVRSSKPVVKSQQQLAPPPRKDSLKPRAAVVSSSSSSEEEEHYDSSRAPSSGDNTPLPSARSQLALVQRLQEERLALEKQEAEQLAAERLQRERAAYAAAAERERLMSITNEKDILAEAMAEAAASVAARKAALGQSESTVSVNVNEVKPEDALPLPPVSARLTTNTASSLGLGLGTMSKWAVVAAPTDATPTTAEPPRTIAAAGRILSPEPPEPPEEVEDPLAARAAKLEAQAEDIAQELAEAEQEYQDLLLQTNYDEENEEVKQARELLEELYQVNQRVQAEATEALQAEQEAFDKRQQELEEAEIRGRKEGDDGNAVSDVAVDGTTGAAPTIPSPTAATSKSFRSVAFVAKLAARHHRKVSSLGGITENRSIGSAALDPATRSMRALLIKPLSQDLIELKQPVQPPIIRVEVDSGRRTRQRLLALDVADLTHADPSASSAIIPPSVTAAASSTRSRSRSRSPTKLKGDEIKTDQEVKYI